MQKNKIKGSIKSDQRFLKLVKKIPQKYRYDVTNSLDNVDKNVNELLNCIEKCPQNYLEALGFLLANMPVRDLISLKSDYLLENIKITYEVFAVVPWKLTISKDMFLNYILSYANINERRDNWRHDFYDRFFPVIKDCQTPGEICVLLNEKIWDMINVRYSAKFSKPDQSVYESIDLGIALCTGLSILLINACRSVGVPARFAAIPEWPNVPGNHSWVEVWDEKWHYIGAFEPGTLNKTWFTERAAEVDPNDRMHSIYGVSFKKKNLKFPAIGAMDINYISADNITHLYKINLKQNKLVNVAIRVFNKPGGKRISANVVVSLNDNEIGDGKSRDEINDTYNMLNLKLEPNKSYQIEVEFQGQYIVSDYKTTAEKNQVVDIFMLK